MVIHKDFAAGAIKTLAADPSVIGLAAAGSWIYNELDEYSDLDLILVAKEKVSDDISLMIGFARRLGDYLSGFSGEHVGEPRLLICLYDHPLLHVDIKFLTLDEFHKHIEMPVILLDTDDQLKNILNRIKPKFPTPEFQWIEDRFWTWIHYTLLKIGRGEYLEAFDCFAFLRNLVFGPLMHIKNGNLPRGVRRVETHLEPEDLSKLKRTIPSYERQNLLDTLKYCVLLYRELRTALYDDRVFIQKPTELRVMLYFEEIERKNPSGL
jgi:hypothetical protein